MSPLALAGCVAPYSTEYAVPASTPLDTGYLHTTTTPPAPLTVEVDGHLPVSGCPYPLDRYWDLVGWDGLQYWLSFEVLPTADGCLLWLSEERTHRLYLRHPRWDGSGWTWDRGVRTYWLYDTVVVDGLPGSPWVATLREQP